MKVKLYILFFFSFIILLSHNLKSQTLDSIFIKLKNGKLVYYKFDYNDIKLPQAFTKPDSILLVDIDYCYKIFNNDTIYLICDKEAEYPSKNGFMSEIYKLIVYPKEAKEADLSGIVIAQITLDENGNMINYKIVSTSIPLFDQELLRVIKLMSTRVWTPAKFRNKNVKFQLIVPGNFKLY